MGRGVVTVSLALIEAAIFDDQARIVEVRPVTEVFPGRDQAVVELVIEGQGVPKVNDLGLPRPVRCEITETRRSIEFKVIDDPAPVAVNVCEHSQRGGVFARHFRT